MCWCDAEVVAASRLLVLVMREDSHRIPEVHNMYITNAEEAKQSSPERMENSR